MLPDTLRMAKGSRKKLALSFLIFPILFIVAVRLVGPPHSLAGKFQAAHQVANLMLKSKKEASDEKDYIKFLISRLVRGATRAELGQNGISCAVEPRSTFCVTTAEVRVTAGPPRSPTIYLSAGQVLSPGDTFSVKPYPRTTDPEAMLRTAPVQLVAGEPGPPPCDVTHTAPAVVFSTGGFAGNNYHDISEVLMPLFLTAGLFRSHVQLVVTDYEQYWVDKYRRFLEHVSVHELVVASSRYGDVAGGVHCFPAAVVGLKFHDHLLCNESRAPGGAGNMDFKRFLHEAFSLKVVRLTANAGRPPLLVLISRWRSRVLLNQREVVELAEQVGFRVEVVWPDTMKKVDEIGELINSCSVLMGIHGAGLANMIFLPDDAVLLQVVPLGLDWQAGAYYSRQSVELFGLRYVEYKAAADESSLYKQYPRDDPVLTDPWSINRQGYNVSRPLYTDGQNVTINISRFRGTLEEAKALLPVFPS